MLILFQPFWGVEHIPDRGVLDGLLQAVWSSGCLIAFPRGTYTTVTQGDADVLRENCLGKMEIVYVLSNSGLTLNVMRRTGMTGQKNVQQLDAS